MEAGGEDFTDLQFATLATGIISSTSINDRRFTVSIKDPRAGLHRSLSLKKYTTTEFPNLYAGATGGEGAGDVPRPYYYGAVTHTSPVCIDTIKRVFELMDGRITGVSSVVLNGVTLTAAVDYFIDYGKGRIRLAPALTFSTDSDTLTVAFTGAADASGYAIEHGPAIFLDLLRNFMGLGWDDIDLDSIAEAAAAKTAHLAVKIYKDTTTQDVIELLEKSCLAYSYQDQEGRIGFRIETTTAPSDVAYIPEQRIIEIGTDESIDDLFAQIHVHYDEWPTTQRYRWIQKDSLVAQWVYGILKRLDIYTAHTTEANALTLGDAILAVLNRPAVKITTTRALMPRQVGDMIYVTRRRFFDLLGTANKRLMRITSISKSPGAATVQVTAEVV